MTTGFDPYQPNIWAIPNAERASVTVQGILVPTGTYTVQRSDDGGRSWVAIRAGTGTITTGQFHTEDTEPPLGVELRYKVTIDQDGADVIERNFVLTPRVIRGIGSWVVAAPRVGTVVTDTDPAVNGEKVLQVSADSAGYGTSNRNRLATVGLGTLAAGSYHISGRVKYYDANVMRWLELRDGPPPRTWAGVKAMGSWGTVRGSASSAADVPYGEVQISIVDSGGTVVAGPIVAVSPSVNLSQQWIEFNLTMTLAAALTGGRVVVSHGGNLREYTATWWLTRFIVLPTTQTQEPYLHFFDGDWPVPAYAEDYEWENGVFDSLQQGVIAWEGTAGNSTSIFSTPDVVYAVVGTRVDPPASAPVCDPVHLNLPIQPTMGQWFGLIKVSTLSHPGRTAVLEIIRRRPAIVVSDARGWERGELTLLTRTLDERRMAVGIFATGQIVQFRNPNQQYPEGNEGGPWYLGVTDVNEERPFKDHRRAERFWTCSFVRVEKPVGLIDATYGTGSSWQHTKDTPTGQTWQGVKDDYANWADVLYRDVAPTDPTAQFAGGGAGLPTEQANDAWQQEVLPTP